MTNRVISFNAYSECFSFEEAPSHVSRVQFHKEPQKKATIVRPNFTKGKDTKPTMMQKMFIASIAALYLASMIEPAQASMMVTNAKEAGLPSDVDTLLSRIQWICLGVCGGVAIIMGMVAGFFRMVGLREEARKRYADAIIGMLMVLTAPPVLLLIATIARGVIQLLPGATQ